MFHVMSVCVNVYHYVQACEEVMRSAISRPHFHVPFLMHP